MKSIAVGKKHTLLLTIDGLVYAMGKNRAGCLGAFFSPSVFLMRVE
jgi:alpha-tubulin suppressor-like RCC1 family protein